ncbi:MAG: class I SAM-dependent methyltransferase, partial [Pacificimonas sp.]
MSLFTAFISRAIQRGTLDIMFADGSSQLFGAAEAGFPDVAIRFNDKRAPGYIARHPRLGAALAFMDGRLDVVNGDIRDLVRLIRMNSPFERGGSEPLAGTPVAKTLRAVKAALPTMNTPTRSRKNVAHHYDLGDRLYDLFLDRDRQYSCAYFPNASVDDTELDLDEAQARKKAHIAAKLALEPGQHVLDIGCGWGGMALYLNRVAGVKVTGVTLSTEQLATARRRAQEAGVADDV